MQSDFSVNRFGIFWFWFFLCVRVPNGIGEKRSTNKTKQCDGKPVDSVNNLLSNVVKTKVTNKIEIEIKN